MRDAFNDNSIKVPFFQPAIDENDISSVSKALRFTLLTDGPKLQEFEKKFARFIGSKYAVGVSNATSALHLSLKALGIGRGDEVIIPDITFVATASSVLLAGATPVLADVDYSDYNISVTSIKKNITNRTRAIIPVHFAGKACNIQQIKKIAKSNNLFIIEDCAHALGTQISKKHVGIFGDTGCFSFYPTKNITTIEGGMVVTNSPKVAEYVRIARSHGITRSLKQRYTKGKPWDYDVLEAGYNYRLDEIRASLGLSQMRKLAHYNKLREEAAKYYNYKLGKINGISLPEINKNDSNHLYVIKINQNNRQSRDNLFEKMTSMGVRTTVHYKPLHEFSVFKKKSKHYDSLENSKRIYKEIISLPLYPYITRKEQDYVVSCLK